LRGGVEIAMSAITTFLDRLGFAATCIIGWAIFPVLIAAGIAGLLIYALLAECFSTEKAPVLELEPPAQ
jgi:hypothetical protein